MSVSVTSTQETIMQSIKHIYLASSSPRRVELLNQLGVSFKQISNDFDETKLAHESAENYVQRLALGKASSAYQQHLARHKSSQGTMWPVLGADTIVVFNGECLGKPKDQKDAFAMLKKLSDQVQEVYTAVALYHQDKSQVVLSKSEVKFCALDEQQIEHYTNTDEPYDKAGSYAIQGVAASFVEYIRGSYTGIVGLPLFETRALLDSNNIEHSLNRK